jgi:hypothetical protein
VCGDEARGPAGGAGRWNILIELPKALADANSNLDVWRVSVSVCSWAVGVGGAASYAVLWTPVTSVDKPSSVPEMFPAPVYGS